MGLEETVRSFDNMELSAHKSQPIMKTSFEETDIPYFSWDRKITVAEIRAELAATSGAEWDRLTSWIMREAAFPDVWEFVSPQEVAERLPHLSPFLGRKRDFWQYIIRQWHELGKL